MGTSTNSESSPSNLFIFVRMLRRNWSWNGKRRLATKRSHFWYCAFAQVPVNEVGLDRQDSARSLPRSAVRRTTLTNITPSSFWWGSCPAVPAGPCPVPPCGLHPTQSKPRARPCRPVGSSPAPIALHFMECLVAEEASTKFKSLQDTSNFV